MFIMSMKGSWLMVWIASVRAAPARCAGKLQGALQMILDLRQGLTCKFLEVRVAAVLDLLLEQRGIAPLIFDLAVYIIPVERGAVIRIEGKQHRVIGAVQQRVRRCDILVLQDRIQCINDWNMTGDHQVRVTPNRGAGALRFRYPAGVHLEGSSQVGLADKIEVDSVEHRGRLEGRRSLCIGDADAGSHRDKRVDKTKACEAPCCRCSIHWRSSIHSSLYTVFAQPVLVL